MKMSALAFISTLQQFCSLPLCYSESIPTLALLGESDCSSYSLCESSVLHSYQREALGWMIHRYQCKRNIILADEMGLGKTLEALSFICWMMEYRKTNGPFLIVCPLSVVQNWIEQCRRFCPSVSAISYVATAEDRQAMREPIVKQILLQPVENQKDPLLTFNILITSYEIVLSDFAFLGNFKWKCLIVDEAQRIKNPKSKLKEALMTHYKAKCILLLTGTPIQNNLNELWSLLNFLHPEVLNDMREFVDCFQENGKSNETKLSMLHKNVLHKLLETLMLRRTKDDVTLSALQAISKTEYVVLSPLTAMQRLWYKWLLTRDTLLLNLGNNAEMAFQNKRLDNLVMQLRKCCNHPYLFNGAEPEPFREGDHIWKNCGKMMILDKLLSKLHSNGSRVLLFSGSTQMLDILQDYLDFKEYTYERLDGSMRGEDRFGAINRFSNASPLIPPFVFLLSSRAASVGLNLEAANCVILYDSDWNPQIDKQAIARAFRQGQTKHVQIYRFITAQTVEEVVYRRGMHKLQLTEDVLQYDKLKRRKASLEPSTNQQERLDLRNLVSFGVYNLVNGADTLIKDIEVKSIDEILSNSEVSLNASETDASLLVGPQLRKAAATNKETAAATNKETAAATNKETAAATNKETAAATNKETAAATHDYDRHVSHSINEGCVSSVGELSLVLYRLGFRLSLWAKRPLYSSGRDYRLQRVSNESSERHTRDEEALQQLADSSVGFNSLFGVNASKEAAPAPAVSYASTNEMEAKRNRRLERWRRNNYTDMKLELHETEASTVHYLSKDYVVTDTTKPIFDKPIHYLTGNAAQPAIESHTCILLHCTDDSGSWPKKGFFKAISDRSTLPEDQYTAAKKNNDLHVGDVHFIATDDPYLFVALCICQKYKSADRSQIIIDAVHAAFLKVQNMALSLHASIHLPRIGFARDRRKDQWYEMEHLLKKYFARRSIDTFVYYYKKGMDPKLEVVKNEYAAADSTVTRTIKKEQ